MSEYLNRVQQIEKDTEQWAAFHSEGSQVVVAGPGSGKTYLLTAKVAKLLLEDTVRYPQKIACITFSRQLAEKLVKELRELGVYDAERVYVGTIHAFCIAEILLPAVNLLPPGSIPDPFRIASEEETKNALSAALQLQSKPIPITKNDLDKFRRRYFLPEEFSFSSNPLPGANNSNWNHLQNLDWRKLAEDYHKHIRKAPHASMDFVQVEMLALHILKTKPSLAATLSAAYPWWFVDEYQDLSPLFHHMAMHLVEQKGISVFAIGDPNQCIYEELQGSRPENLGDLAKMVERVEQNKPIQLLKNYRSPQNIIDVSDCVLEKNNDYQSADKEMRGGIHVILVKNYPISKLVSRMLRKRDSIQSNEKLAILIPGKPTRDSLLPKLEQLNMDIRLYKDPDFNSHTELLEWLQKLAQWCSGQNVYFYQLTPFWHGFCQPEGAYADAKHLERERELFDAIRQLRNSAMLLGDWLKEIHQTVLTEVRLVEYEKFRPDDVKEFRQLLKKASTVPRLQNKTVRSFGRIDAKILLTTFYSSKGLQFDTTIVIDLDGVSRKSVTDLHKRIAYVAVSRAISRLYIFVFNEQGEFAQKLKHASAEHWVCDTSGNITKRVQ